MNFVADGAAQGIAHGVVFVVGGIVGLLMLFVIGVMLLEFISDNWPVILLVGVVGLIAWFVAANY
jgi:hypothetical protein